LILCKNDTAHRISPNSFPARSQKDLQRAGARLPKFDAGTINAPSAATHQADGMTTRHGGRDAITHYALSRTRTHSVNCPLE